MRYMIESFYAIFNFLNIHVQFDDRLLEVPYYIWTYNIRK